MCLTCFLLRIVETMRCFIKMIFNCALDYDMRRVQVNYGGLKLNGGHQLLDYADDVNKLDGIL